ncbi:MAG TPA: hypothetical protein VL728_14180 [Cyclobacteriaceae bacterium]|jgi:hypothetical protein|nr:hypothetical protein [Cyclobacteriaceae bacterium]
MRLIVIVALLVVSFNSYGKFYPGTLMFENGKSREGFIDTNLGDIILFKGWMESPPEEVPAGWVTAVWIKANAGHKMLEYHYVAIGNDGNHMWLRSLEKGVVNLYAQENILQQDGTDKTEVLEFYCLRKGETNAKHIASHSNRHVFKSNAPQFFADNHQLVEKIKSQEYNWANLQELVRAYNKGF